MICGNSANKLFYAKIVILCLVGTDEIPLKESDAGHIGCLLYR